MTIKHSCRIALLSMVLFVVSNASAALESFGPAAIGTSHSGYWVGAYSSGPDANSDVALLKYDNDGVLVFARPYGVVQGFKDHDFYGFTPLRDGGAIVIGRTISPFGTLPPAYSYHRVDSTGAPVWSLTGLSSMFYPDDNFDTFGTFLLGADVDGDVWFPADGHIYRVNPAGALTDFGQVSTSPDEEYASAVDPSNGTLYFALADSSNLLSPVQLQRYTLSGSKTSVWTAPETSTRLQFLTIGSDGNLYGIGNNATTHFAISFSPSGSVRWSKTFGSSLYAFANYSQVAQQAAAFSDGRIVALDTSGALYVIGTTGQVQQIPDTGYVASQFNDTFVGVAYPDDIVLSSYGGAFLRLTTTGQPVANLPVDDTGLPPTLLSDGSMIIRVDTPGGVFVQHIDRIGHDLGNGPNLVASLDPPAQMRVDQIGLDGAWFASAESGQGFTIDYIPANNVLFLPWFTYDVDPTSDTSGLAWVTFQGSPAPDGKSATLSIARSNPGAFNSGIVPNTIIGSGLFTATDCSHARLQYQFNDGEFGGLGGYIPLVRIASSTTPCIQANGQTTPAQAADVPLHGFDANQSGSWFDPGTSGQGIEFTVVPASTGLPSGLVFGAWFTFDAPPANDAAHEHWFTLQGDLSAALNGTVSLPILQTIGGSLDSLPASGTSQVGTVTLSMLSCTSATMAYHFDSSAAAKTFAGLSGTINLSKIGGCVAQ